MQLILICENCSSELNAHHGKDGIRITPCDCQAKIHCDVCELEMKGSIMKALKDGWVEVDARLWYCQECAEKWPVDDSVDDVGAGPDHNEKTAMMSVRVGWK